MATVNISHHYGYYQGKPREATESAPQNMPKEKKKKNGSLYGNHIVYPETQWAYVATT